MTFPLRFYAFPLITLMLAGCATQGKPPPVIPLDEPVEAQFIPNRRRRWKSSPCPNRWRCRHS